MPTQAIGGTGSVRYRRLGYMTDAQARILRGPVVLDYGERAADALRDAPSPTAPAPECRNAPQGPQNAPQGHQED